jgi:hypothetical protein
MTGKDRSLEELVTRKKSDTEVNKSDKSDKSGPERDRNLSPTQPTPDEPREDRDETQELHRETPVVVKGNVKVEGDNAIREDRVENFDTRGNEITDNYPLDWERAPAGTVIASGAVPSDNAVVVNEFPRAEYAGENEYDDKGLKEDDDEEVPEPPDVEEPPIEETETPARETHKVPVTESPRSDASRNKESDSKLSGPTPNK